MVFGLTEMLVMDYSEYDNLDKTYHLPSCDNDLGKLRSRMLLHPGRIFCQRSIISPCRINETIMPAEYVAGIIVYWRSQGNAIFSLLGLAFW
jgi:hypothetical protein